MNPTPEQVEQALIAAGQVADYNYKSNGEVSEGSADRWVKAFETVLKCIAKTSSSAE